jgi:hypothetical protein
MHNANTWNSPSRLHGSTCPVAKIEWRLFGIARSPAKARD